MLDIMINKNRGRTFDFEIPNPGDLEEIMRTMNKYGCTIRNSIFNYEDNY